jgi:rhodanese-related sulfurtransferase
MKPIDAKTLAAWLHDGAEIALLDVREHGQYGESHLFFGVPLPWSRLELEAPRLLPCKTARIVAYDDGALGVARLAAGRLEELGYARVHVLEGGTEAWRRAGHPLFKGVNVPSKTFGELVEHASHTPRISAADLAAMQRAGSPLAILDGRPLAEFRKMSIPGARCCPNGELAYRVAAMVPDARTPIVVNCAGRTRSIIGAQTLIDLGIPNPVYALENGTQGWYLADLALDHGATRGYPEAVDGKSLAAARLRARALGERHGVRWVDDGEAAGWLADEGRTTYLLDVRTAEEFAARTLTGAVHAPGGQLLQATDQWIAVRGARILIFDSDGTRAPVIASWLARMGHDANVLAAGIESRVAAKAAKTALPDIAPIAADALATGLGANAVTVVDVRPSMAYRKAHVPGSTWSIRPRFDALAARLAGRHVALVAEEPGMAAIAARDLARSNPASIARLDGGLAGWQRAGHPVESTPGDPPDADCIDYLFFVHDRHEGNKDAARRYLAWETQLLSQVEDADLASYRLKPAQK